MSSALTGLRVAGDARAWESAGFAVADDTFTVGEVTFVIDATEPGISAWSLDALDGISSFSVPRGASASHPNGATVLDHLVLFTDDPDRTTRTFADAGIDVRRVRDVGKGRTQTFFRAGEVILELVGPIDGPVGTRLWGLAFTVDDLDACAELLGDRLGPTKDAVQKGRRIATFRHAAVGLDIPIAFMSS